MVPSLVAGVVDLVTIVVVALLRSLWLLLSTPFRLLDPATTLVEVLLIAPHH